MQENHGNIKLAALKEPSDCRRHVPRNLMDYEQEVPPLSEEPEMFLGYEDQPNPNASSELSRGRSSASFSFRGEKSRLPSLPTPHSLRGRSSMKAGKGRNSVSEIQPDGQQLIGQYFGKANLH